jgi:hypothetical protein
MTTTNHPDTPDSSATNGEACTHSDLTLDYTGGGAEVTCLNCGFTGPDTAHGPRDTDGKHPAYSTFRKAAATTTAPPLSGEETSGECPYFGYSCGSDKQCPQCPAPQAATTEQAQPCTCPSGDGSLRWPCPQHPPAAAKASASWEVKTWRERYAEARAKGNGPRVPMGLTEQCKDAEIVDLRAYVAGLETGTNRLNEIIADLRAALAGREAAPPDYSEMSREQLERHAARMAQALADNKPREFWQKHANGPMLPPSCLCCGKLPDEVAIKHLELPGIVICRACRDAALAQPAAPVVDGELPPLTFDAWLDREYPTDHNGRRQGYRDRSPTDLMRATWQAACVAAARSAPVGDAVRDATWRHLLEAVVREFPRNMGRSSNGNAPGHCHSRPGIWDDDNGALSGKPCAWCIAWNGATQALTAPSHPEPTGGKEGA